MKFLSTIATLSFYLIIFYGDAMAATQSSSSHLAEKSVEFFNRLDKNHLELVDQFYDKNVVFQDPIHQLKGVDAVRRYYEGLYKNVKEIRFEYGKQVEDKDTVVLTWRMFLKAPAIESGREITVDGTSVITFGGPEGKAITHRDYFDMGEFIYEHVPLLKSLIHYIKGRMT